MMVKHLVFVSIILFGLAGCGVDSDSSGTESTQDPGLVTIQPSEIGVVFERLSGDLLEPLREGTHQVNPLLYEVTVYSLEQQQYTMSSNPGEGQVQGNDGVRARTLDGEEVIVDLTVLYRINPLGTNVNIVHRTWQDRYEEDFIRPTARGIVREVVAGYTAEEIWGAMRVQVETDIQDQLATEFAAQGLELINLLIRNVTFSEAYTEMIEQTAIYQMHATQTATAAPEPVATPTP